MRYRRLTRRPDTSKAVHIPRQECLRQASTPCVQITRPVGLAKGYGPAQGLGLSGFRDDLGKEYQSELATSRHRIRIDSWKRASEVADSRG